MENKALEMPKVMSHRIETKLRPIIRIEAPQPKLNLWNITSTSKSNISSSSIILSI